LDKLGFEWADDLVKVILTFIGARNLCISCLKRGIYPS
jgi:hypothetical protein